MTTSETSYETILVERDQRVGIITLNRPQALNALNSQVMNEVTTASTEFDRDPGIGAIIITGSAKAFAAGADIKEMARRRSISLNNVLARTDGALFSGPTFNNTIWKDLTSTRDAGSSEWLPIYNDGRNVRFAARPSNLDRPNRPWDTPRVMYLQHASDPIACWTPDLLFAKPDWLRERRGYDVLP